MPCGRSWIDKEGQLPELPSAEEVKVEDDMMAERRLMELRGKSRRLGKSIFQWALVENLR